MFYSGFKRLVLLPSLFLFLLAFPPLSVSQEMTDLEIISALNTNLTRQLDLTERAWSKYLISDENWRQEKSLSLTLDQIVKADSITISNLETSLSKQESSLTTASSYSMNLEEDLQHASKKLKIYKYSTIGLGLTVLILILIR